MDIPLEFTLSPEELADAQSIIRRFRWGNTTGLVLYIFLFLLFAGGTSASILVSRFPPDTTAAPDPLPDMLLRTALFAAPLLPLFISFIRAATVRCRSEIPVSTPVRLRLTADTLHIEHAQHAQTTPWYNFATALLKPRFLLIVSVNSFIPIPTRALPGIDLETLRRVLDEAITKRSPAEAAFPVLLTQPQSPLPPPP
jgi:hypothetical protein